MATGGIFTLITNDGKQDRMLMATHLLNRRLRDIRCAKTANGDVDPTPTLMDIEKTHILFMNAHFKPFAAIGYEYNKVRPQSGNAKLGGSAQFSIPQFGDFFHDMALHVIMDAPTVTAIAGLPDDEQDYIKFADFLGHRLVKQVKMEVNGNPLDSYGSDVYNFHWQFCVQPGKRTGWRRNVGQEESLEALGRSTAGVREAKDLRSGPQTPKATQQPVELWIPLLFWFNLDPRLAIPSVSIPYGQRFVTFDFATKDELICTVPSTAELVRAEAAFDATHAANAFSEPAIELELIINNIFVNPEIHDIFIKRIGFSLIRVHRQQNVNVTRADDEILLNNLKWPVETLYIGLRPSSNSSTAAAQNPRDDFTDVNVDPANRVVGQYNVEDWHRYHSVTNLAYIAADGSEYILKAAVPTMDRISISAHGIPIYNDIPAQFFNSYIPYTYGGHLINTPEDVGVLMVTFNLYPGSYQPSGHVNVSRAREFYFKYSSSVITTSNPGQLVIVAIAINFLLISDGSAVLRYST